MIPRKGGIPLERAKLQARIRTKTGKGAARKLRRAGRIPAILYGKKITTQPLEVEERALCNLLSTSGPNVIIDLEVLGNEKQEMHTCMISELQREPIRRSILHADFHRISLEEKVTATVSIVLRGESPGVKSGGILDHLIHEVEVESLPLSIPDQIEADISNLEIDQALRVKDIKLPEGVEILRDEEDIVVIVHPPKGAEEAPAATETARAPEPERVGRKKEEE
jgi:large subunit ribosomal protein L25